MRKIRIYYQHTNETCGICCALMLMDYFGIDFPTVGKEKSLYNDYQTDAFPGTSGAAVALLLSRRRLQVTLAHSSEALIDNQEGYYPPDVYEKLLDEYNTRIADSNGAVLVEKGVKIDCAALRRELAQNRLVIVQRLVPGNADGMHDHVLHGTLLYDCDDTHFFACDPSFGKLKMTDAELEADMDTPVGRMYISAGRKTTS